MKKDEFYNWMESKEEREYWSGNLNRATRDEQIERLEMELKEQQEKIERLEMELKEQIELANPLIDCPEIMTFRKCGSGKYCNYCKYVEKYK